MGRTAALRSEDLALGLRIVLHLCEFGKNVSSLNLILFSMAW